ncbi:MAG: hypothetical protein JO130_06415 [Solirubrobacterales bacterium]|nr:hypothetical protein [Solirubrobacterales bacterium]
MNALTNLIKELRERKLWPIAIGLIVALVAVPVLLSKQAPTNLVTQPTGGLPYSTGTALPAISIKTTPAASKLAGSGRNPFTPQDVATTATTTTTTTTSTTASPSTGASTGSTGSSTSSPSSGGSTTPSTQSSTPPATTTPQTLTPPTPTPAPPAPAGLTAKQSYEVSLAITDSNGGVNTIDPLERLSVLPGVQQPLLVELGVLQGGKQVLFAIEPGAAVSGPGTCTPGPIDCEVLSLSPGQTEGVSKQTATGTTGVAEFAVNAISAVDHPTVAAADQARRKASEAGRELLANTTLGAVSLFPYDPNVGAVVDLRNLTVGG